MPRVSVVVPAYNYGRYLAEAVESVLAQTFQDLEVIVVDDGSTDDTLAVARRLADADARVSVITQENGGHPAITRNRGIAAARGEHVLCLDADDLLGPTVIALCVAELDADPAAAIAYPRTRMFGERELLQSVAEWSLERLARCNFLTCGSLFRREAWVAAGGFDTIGYEDWDLWLAMAEAGHVGRPAREAIYHYRQHGGEGRCSQDRVDDQRLKAQIVLKRSGLFSDAQLRWAAGVLAGDPAALAVDGAEPGHVPALEDPAPAGAASVTRDRGERADWLLAPGTEADSPLPGRTVADVLGLAQRLGYTEARDDRGAVVAVRRAKDPILFPVPFPRAAATDAERAAALAAAVEHLVVAQALRTPTLDTARTSRYLGIDAGTLPAVLQAGLALVADGAATVPPADAPALGAVAALLHSERLASGDRATAERAHALARGAARAGLQDARRVTVLAYGDELVADPALLSSYGATFGADDDVTLVIATEDATGLSVAVAAAGLDSAASPDMLAVASAPPLVDAVFSRRPHANAPRFDDTTAPALRALVAAA